MGFVKAFKNKIFSENFNDFEAACIELFRFQFQNNPVYHAFCSYLHVSPDEVKKIHDIPFLPIELFKKHKILCHPFRPRLIFESSGTTGMQRSRHYMAFPSLYHQSFRRAFNLFFGPVEDYIFLALLPGYLERKYSSLVYMVNGMIKMSQNEEGGFYLHNMKKLARDLEKLKNGHKKIILFGVTHALLSFVENYHPDLSSVIVMETGGMKGHGKEIPREQVYEILRNKGNASSICSEYGMTELSSQAYALRDGVFSCPPWMQVLMRDIYDPFCFLPLNKSGAINIIDLANITSCAFIATQDLGVLLPEGKFKVLGRTDHSDLRGCNLLVN